MSPGSFQAGQKRKISQNVETIKTAKFQKELHSQVPFFRERKYEAYPLLCLYIVSVKDICIFTAKEKCVRICTFHSLTPRIEIIILKQTQALSTCLLHKPEIF